MNNPAARTSFLMRLSAYFVLWMLSASYFVIVSTPSGFSDTSTIEQRFQLLYQIPLCAISGCVLIFTWPNVEEGPIWNFGIALGLYLGLGVIILACSRLRMFLIALILHAALLALSMLFWASYVRQANNGIRLY